MDNCAVVPPKETTFRSISAPPPCLKQHTRDHNYLTKGGIIFQRLGRLNEIGNSNLASERKSSVYLRKPVIPAYRNFFRRKSRKDRKFRSPYSFLPSRAALSSHNGPCSTNPWGCTRYTCRNTDKFNIFANVSSFLVESFKFVVHARALNAGNSSGILPLQNLNK